MAWGSLLAIFAELTELMGLTEQMAPRVPKVPQVLTGRTAFRVPTVLRELMALTVMDLQGVAMPQELAWLPLHQMTASASLLATFAGLMALTALMVPQVPKALRELTALMGYLAQTGPLVPMVPMVPMVPTDPTPWRWLVTTRRLRATAP